MQSLREYLEERVQIERAFEPSWQLTKDYNCAVLTAYLDTLTEEENYERLKRMKSILLTEGYNATEIEGSHLEFEKYREQDKQIVSLFVVDFWRVEANGLYNDCLNLAHEYNQNSFLYITDGGETVYQVGSSEEDDVYPAYNDKVDFLDTEYINSLKEL